MEKTGRELKMLKIGKVKNTGKKLCTHLSDKRNPYLGMILLKIHCTGIIGWLVHRRIKLTYLNTLRCKIIISNKPQKNRWVPKKEK